MTKAEQDEKLAALYAQDSISDGDLYHTAYLWAKGKCAKGVEPTPAQIAAEYHELTGRRLFTAETKVVE
jgi:hypothetical protein